MININQERPACRQAGIAHLLLILLAAIGIIAFILFSSSADFKNKLFSTIFPNKPKSHAAESAPDVFAGFAYDINKDGRINLKDYLKASSKLVRERTIFPSGTTNTSSKQLTFTSQGYILEFQDEPIVEHQKKLKEENKSTSSSVAQDYKKSILSKHENIKREILSRLNKKDFVSRSIQKEETDKEGNIRLLGEYTTVLNGIALDIDEKELEKIKDMNEIKKITPNFPVHAQLNDSVPLIKANQVWSLTQGLNNITGKNVKVAVLDTGIDYTHPDLGSCTKDQFLNKQCSKVIDGYNFLTNSQDAMDDNRHGTHVASSVAGNGSIKGVAPDAKLIAYKVLDLYGSGDEAGVIAAIDKSADPNGDGVTSDHYDIISMSLGGPGDPDKSVALAVDRAVDAGIVTVVAAGNSGPSIETIGSPGVARKALTVGASDKSDKMAYFSSRGIVPQELGKTFELIKPDVVAPGVDICAAKLSTISYSDTDCIDNKHIKLSGTSMATPQIAGVAALIKQMHPDWSAQEIKSAITTTATDIGDNLIAQGAGRVDALKAVQATTLITPNSLSFGLVDRSVATWSATKTITIKNTKSTTSVYNLSPQQVITGASFNFSKNNFSIGANQADTLTVSVSIDNSKLKDGFYTGSILIKDDQNNIYRLPFLFFRENMQISFDRTKTNKYYIARISTPHISLASQPSLVITSPSGNKTTVPTLDHPFGLISNSTVWESPFIIISSEGNYNNQASSSLISSYQTSGTVVGDFTPPILSSSLSNDASPANTVDLYTTYSETLGTTFAPHFSDSFQGSDPFVDWWPALYAENNNVYQIYYREVYSLSTGVDTFSLQFVKSNNYGNTWSTPQQIGSVNPYGDIIFNSGIAKVNGKLVVVYASYNSQGVYSLYSTQSSDDGLTWSSPIQIATNFHSDDWKHLALKTDGNKLHLVYDFCKNWQDLYGLYQCTDEGVRYGSSSDGTVWNFVDLVEFQKNDSPAFENMSFGVDMALNQGKINIIYLVGFNSGYYGTVMYFTSQDGTNWTKKDIYRDEQYLASYPSLVSNGSNLYLIWEANDGLAFAKSINNGNSWEVRRRFTGSFDWLANLSWSQDKLYLLFIRGVFGKSYLRTSSDQGNSWSTDVILDNNQTWGGSLVSDQLTTHMAWPSTFDLTHSWRALYANDKQLMAKISSGDNTQYKELMPTSTAVTANTPNLGNNTYYVDIGATDLAGNSTSYYGNFNYPFACNVCSADVNKSGYVNGADTSFTISCIGKKSTEQNSTGRYCYYADTDQNGIVESTTDITCISSKFLKQCTNPTCTACSADVDKSSYVTIADTSFVSSCFGKTTKDVNSSGISCSSADIDKDGLINEGDLSCIQFKLNQACPK